MPQKIAQIGVEVTHVVKHCPTAHCFEKVLEYEAPNEQLFGLLQASPSCTQRITFDCYLSPVKVLKILLISITYYSYSYECDKIKKLTKNITLLLGIFF